MVDVNLSLADVQRRVAELVEVPCPEPRCKNGTKWSGEEDLGPIDPLSHLTRSIGILCPSCHGKGKVFPLRRKCPCPGAPRDGLTILRMDGGCYKCWAAQAHQPDCASCLGTDWVPTTDLGALLAAALWGMPGASMRVERFEDEDEIVYCVQFGMDIRGLGKTVDEAAWRAVEAGDNVGDKGEASNRVAGATDHASEGAK